MVLSSVVSVLEYLRVGQQNHPMFHLYPKRIRNARIEPRVTLSEEKNRQGHCGRSCGEHLYLRMLKSAPGPNVNGLMHKIYFQYSYDVNSNNKLWVRGYCIKVQSKIITFLNISGIFMWSDSGTPNISLRMTRFSSSRIGNFRCYSKPRNIWKAPLRSE